MEKFESIMAEVGRVMDAFVEANKPQDPPPVANPAPEPPLPAPVGLTNVAEFRAALDQAVGGEVIQLADVSFGSVVLNCVFGVPVTIRGGRFDALKINTHHWKHRGGGIIIDGATASYMEARQVANVAFINCDANQLEVASSNSIRIEGNHLHDGHFPLRVERCFDFQVLGNLMERAREDTMRISGDSYNGVVRGNIFRDNRAAMPMHGDHLQIFGISGEDVCPRDLLIERNLLHEDARGKAVFHLKDGDSKKGQNWKAGDPATPAPAQGFFVGAAQKTMYRNVVIRHNLMRLSLKNGIFVSAGIENYPITENILLPVEGRARTALVLNKDAKNQHWHNRGVTVSRNIVPEILDEGREATVHGDNHVFGSAIDGLFAGITVAGGGEEPEDYLLADGSPIPGELVSNWLPDAVATIRANLDRFGR